MQFNRRITYKLYPSKTQQGELLAALRLHQQLYNAALEERISAYRRIAKSISFAEQCRSLTEIRRDDPAYRTLNCHAIPRHGCYFKVTL